MAYLLLRTLGDMGHQVCIKPLNHSSVQTNTIQELCYCFGFMPYNDMLVTTAQS